ncbi:MAG: tRNA (guanosine(37)-N1)-methyltransferase TrmD [Pseudomonadota bacterium]
MKFDILTIFPDFFTSPLNESIIKRAVSRDLLEFCVHDIRKSSTDKHRSVDDAPYGGGAGMVMRADVVTAAIEKVEKKESACTILLSPSGELFNQKIASELASLDQLILICGRYEGIDQRVADLSVDRAISIGDYILSGGESAAMVLIEAISRLIPGVLGNEESARFESFERGLLEHPHYTRPEVFKGLKVPDVLLSGNHAQIDSWRDEKSIEITKRVRPDLYQKYVESGRDSGFDKRNKKK